MRSSCFELLRLVFDTAALLLIRAGCDAWRVHPPMGLRSEKAREGPIGVRFGAISDALLASVALIRCPVPVVPFIPVLSPMHQTVQGGFLLTNIFKRQ
jgi:hypothetical protein